MVAPAGQYARNRTLSPIGPSERRRVSTSTMTANPKRNRKYSHIHRQRLDRAVGHYLRDCYQKRTAARVSELAIFLGRNPEYLTRIVMSFSGMSLREYLRAKQLEEAERLILNTPLPMQEIALHAGFGTTSTFYRCFREVHHIPPGAFREVRK